LQGGARGLVNVQYVEYDGDVYVLEVNPRSSRTVPFLSKATGIPMVRLAMQTLFGASLRELGWEPGLAPVPPLVAVKAPVFSMAKLSGVDTYLGPEMKSTGEVMGVDRAFPPALLKAMIAAGSDLVWVGEAGVRLYSAGQPGGARADRLLHQARLALDPDARLRVVRKMYDMRFGEPAPQRRSVEQLRGIEGARVKRLYELLARRHGVAWKGRRYDPADWAESDLPNRCLSQATACPYGLAEAAILARLVRSSLIESLEQDYITTARAKGASDSRVTWRHGLRNALVPVVTMIGLQIGNLLGASVVIETLFGRQGVGKLVVDSILQRELAVLQGSILILASIFVLINVVVDIFYKVLDPRVKLGAA